LKLTLSADSLSSIQWFVDASHQTHNDCKGHTGAFLTFGKGATTSSSNKQKLNTKSSTETEIVAVYDKSGDILWTRNFLEAQGYTITDNIIFQDNMSTLSLLKNGRISSSKRTKHIKAKYFFLQHYYTTGEIGLQCCPTKQMWADILTKPLQGSKCRQMQASFMNCSIDYSKDPPFLPTQLKSSTPILPMNTRIKPTIVPSPRECVAGSPTSPRIQKAVSSTVRNVPVLRSKQVTWKDVPSPRPCHRNLYRAPVATE
jgi:hypothetical protein